MLLLQVCTFSEALAEGAIKMGMPSALAHRIAAQTLLVSEGFLGRTLGRLCSGMCAVSSKQADTPAKFRQAGETCSCPPQLSLNSSPQGTAKMLQQEGKHPAQLRTDVLTPAGTTIHGLHALEKGGLRAAAMSAVEAATCRAKELSKK